MAKKRSILDRELTQKDWNFLCFVWWIGILGYSISRW